MRWAGQGRAAQRLTGPADYRSCGSETFKASQYAEGQAMKRLIIKLGAVVILLLIVTVVAGAFFINSIARKGIESGSTYALGVPTTLVSARVGLTSGEFSMSGLNVANPAGGFTTSDFLSLGEGSVAVSLGSLRDDVVELPTLTLSDISMNLERKGALSNYQIILDNLKRFESGESKPAEPGGPSKKFVIRKLQIRDVNVHVDLLPEGGKLTQVDVPIDLIELKDVGSGGKSVGISDLAGVILKTIITVAIQKGGDLIPGDISGELTRSLGELRNLSDQDITVLLGDGTVVKTLGKTGEELRKAAGDVGKKAEEGVKRLGEGIGNILGGEKKKDEK